MKIEFSSIRLRIIAFTHFSLKRHHFCVPEMKTTKLKDFKNMAFVPYFFYSPPHKPTFLGCERKCCLAIVVELLLCNPQLMSFFKRLCPYILKPCYITNDENNAHCSCSRLGHEKMGKVEEIWYKCHIFEILKLDTFHFCNIKMLPI